MYLFLRVKLHVLSISEINFPYPWSLIQNSCTFFLEWNFMYPFLSKKLSSWSQRQTSHTLGLRVKLHVLCHLIVKFHVILVSEWNFKYPHSLGEAWYTPWFWSEVHDRHLLFCSNYNGWFICSMWLWFQSEVLSQWEAPCQHQGLWVQVSCHLQVPRIV